MKKIFVLFLIICIGLPVGLHAQIAVTANNNANALAQKLVGFGVTVTNATLDCGSANGDNINHGSGMFTVTSSNLGLDSGIVLTSGVAATNGTILGVNNINASAFSPSNSTNLIGDPDLTTLVGGTTNDKCILEFDFTTLGDTVKFDYVFGSSEYESFTCSNFNDVFGFFISGPGIAGPYTNGAQNIALVPGSTTCPVAISTIYCPNNPGCCNTTNFCFGNTAGCSAFSAANNTCQYFVCNSALTTVTYPGFTTVLTAMSPVIPCSTYHLKLAIADKADHILDSGVFLKAGSFTSNIIQVKLNTGLTSTSGTSILVEGCDSAQLRITRRIVSGTPYADTINFVYGGNAQSAIDYTPLPNQITFLANAADTVRTLSLYAFQDGLVEGTEYLKIYVLSGCAQLITDSLIIEIKDSLQYTLFNGDTAICLGNSVPITGIMDQGLQMQWSPATYVQNPNDFLTSITPTAPCNIVYTVTGTYGTCAPVKRSFRLIAEPVPQVLQIPDKEICEGAPLFIDAVVYPPFNYNVSWTPSSKLQFGSDPYYPEFIGNTSETIEFSASSPIAACTVKDTFTVTVWPFMQGDIKDDTLVCDGNGVQLWVNGGTGNYQWYSPANLSCEFCQFPVANIMGSERFYAILLDTHGCQDTLNVFVEIQPPFQMQLFNQDTTIYLGETVQLVATGAPYYYWTPTNYLTYSQSNDPVATPLEDITYYVTGVSQLQGCPQTDSIKIKVIEQDVFVPNAFTPNNDGLNDVFHITARKMIEVQEFKIFNRWGQEIFSTNDIRKGWNGTFKGVPQDAGVYHYLIRTASITGKVQLLKGDITLIR